ncbi:MAG: O-antigen ligase family protein [bacterium]
MTSESRPVDAPVPVTSGTPAEREGAAPKRKRYDAASLVAVGGLTMYVAVSLFGAGGRALVLTFPVGCLFVALLTYARSPATFVTFTFWLWLLTPFIRRIFDLKYGFHPTSPLLLAPLLASSVAVITVLRRRMLLRSSAYLPFVGAFVALSYAFFIGIIRQSLAAASYDLLTWFAPLLFGLHVALEWRQFPQIHRTLTMCALWGLLVTATYAIVQWVQPPIWDRVWVVSAEMFSIGSPNPYVIRVFSTLNAPGPFSIMLVFSLLIGLGAPQRWRALPLAIGIVALVLSKGRSAWGAFFIGALVLQVRQPLRSLPRQWLVLLGVVLLAAPLLSQPKVLSLISHRAGTVANLQTDRSYQSRIDLTRYALSRMALNPAGTGLGALGGASKLLTNSKSGLAFDSGPLEVYSVMGWMGGTLFMMALFAITLAMVRGRANRNEAVSGAVSAVIALLITALFGNIFNGASGFFFWTAVGFATSGRTYSQALELANRYAHIDVARDRLALGPVAAASSAA